ncbi:hypothetical protein ACHAXR_000912, partial [Thalassiosira sp. AJA248-18]
MQDEAHVLVEPEGVIEPELLLSRIREDLFPHENITRLGGIYEFEYTGRERVPRNVTKVVFHPSVTEIDPHAFNSCINLRMVLLNEGLETIGICAFHNCKLLESIKFPSTLHDVGDHAFNCCINLREVVLNEGLQKIGRWTFFHCKSLEIIKFPSTLSEAG